MVASPFPRWNDDRLDDLGKRVTELEPVARDVAVMQSEMKSLGRALDRNTEATATVAKQLETAQMEPIKRGRDFRSQLILVVVGAMAGVTFALIGAALASH